LKFFLNVMLVIVSVFAHTTTPAIAHARQLKIIQVYLRIVRVPATATHRYPGRHLAGVQKTLKNLDSG
jgi:hypothetical protein